MAIFDPLSKEDIERLGAHLQIAAGNLGERLTLPLAARALVRELFEQLAGHTIQIRILGLPVTIRFQRQ